MRQLAFSGVPLWPLHVATATHLLACSLNCSKAATLLRALHIEGLPPTMTAAELSTLMAPYGNVQYAEVSTVPNTCIGQAASQQRPQIGSAPA